jgi:citrate lyase beta subunit
MSRPDLRLAHAACLLFVPGDRPERFAKALAAGADGIVIDLEDAVAPAAKPAARRAAGDWLAGLEGAQRGPAVLLRLNPAATRAGLDDLCRLADGGLPADALMLAKVEDARDVELLRGHDPAARPIAATVETARGLRAAAGIAAALRPGDALVFGGADLAADLGCAFAWEPLLAGRSALVQAAAEAGVAALDVPWLDLADPAGLAAEALRARALGFTGKIAIHPAQVAPIRTAFAPTAEELAYARRIVAAMAAGRGAAQLDGRMVDAALERAARRVLARAPDPS